MTQSAKNVAVFAAGGIATGDHDQGIPALAICLAELAKSNELCVYSMHRANPDRVPAGIRLRQIPFQTKSHRVNLLQLGLLLIIDHLRRRYHLIHAISGQPFGAVAVFLGRLLKIPSLVMLHGGELANMPEIRFGDLRNPKWIKRLNITCQRADVLVALSGFQASGLRNIGVSPDRALVVPLGVDTSRFPFREKELRAPYKFLHVSFGQPVKDMKTLLETFAIVHSNVDSTLVIVGQNHIGQDTQRLVDEHGLHASVELVGSVRNEEIADYLRSAHFFLLTSRYESQAVVLNEAMSAGVVVCSTRVGLASDLGEGSCIVASTGDAKVMAEKILALINDPEEYARKRLRARRWCEEHDVRWTAAQYGRIYQRF